MKSTGRSWATWDHSPIFARIQEEPHINVFQKRNKKSTGWKPTTEDQLMQIEKEVMKDVGNVGEYLLTMQKNIENAAKKIRHRTTAQRKINNKYSRECEATRRSSRKVYNKNQEESAQETGQESQS